MKHFRFRTSCISLLLALAMLAASLCACAVPGEPTASQTDPSNTAVTSADASENNAETTPSCSLPELDYGGDEIVILSRYREGWTAGEIAVESILHEPVNDAVYERNKIVEDRLNIKIRSVEINCEGAVEIVEKMMTSVGGGSHEYDLVAAACYTVVDNSLTGNLRDLRKSAYLDFDKPWWSQGFNESIEYKGMQFAVTGAAVLSMYRFAFATLFNKRLFTEAKVDYLYDNVRNGTWTLDYQNSIVETFYRDNGNGLQDETGDIYGFVSNDYIGVDPYWSACNVRILERDENGDYTFDNFDAQKLQNVAEKVLQLFYGHGNASYDYKHYGNDAEQDDIRNMFAAGNAAMATLRIMALESAVMRDMKDEYGVVPMPKYIEASGIGLACLCAVPFGVPVVFAKKSRSSNIAGEVYTSQVFSFTHGTEHRIMIPRQFLTSADRVLLIDDFLASGEALRGLDDLCRQAGACVVGAGVFVEKVYQGGGNRLREAGMRIESLARITAMSPEAGVTFG